MKLKKISGILLTAAMLISLAAGCNGEDPNPGGNNPTGTGGGTNETGGNDSNGGGGGVSSGDRDLGGKAITIGIFWAPDESDPETDFGRARLAYLDEMQRKHNFTIKQVHLGGHGAVTEIVSASIINKNPAAHICTLDPERFLSMHRQGLFFNVGLATTVDFSDEKWNSIVIDALTFEDGTYGFVQGYNPWNAGVVFFNKNVLSEAGIDPDSIYEHQRAGTWTWDVMLGMAQQVTRDINNDGIPDYYGFCTFARDTLVNAVFSNNGRFVDRDATGRFSNATHTDEFLRAAEFVHNLEVLGLLQPQPEGSAWNWWIEGFNEGKAAFRVHQDYSKSDMQNTNFDWGVAMFPMGPHADRYMSAYYENVNIVPSTFTLEEVDDIMFAYDIYTNPVPGFEDDDEAWKYGLFNSYRDLPSIDDTIALIRTGDHTAFRYEFIIPGFNSGEVADNIWNLEETPAQLITAAASEWNAYIDRVNGWLYGE